MISQFIEQSEERKLICFDYDSVEVNVMICCSVSVIIVDEESLGCGLLVVQETIKKHHFDEHFNFFFYIRMTK